MAKVGPLQTLEYINGLKVGSEFTTQIICESLGCNKDVANWCITTLLGKGWIEKSGVDKDRNDVYIVGSKTAKPVKVHRRVYRKKVADVVKIMPLSPQSRWLYEKIKEYAKVTNKSTANRRELYHYLDMPEATLRKYIKPLEDNGYIGIVSEGGGGKMTIYQFLDKELPEPPPLPPTKEESMKEVVSGIVFALSKIKIPKSITINININT